MAAHNRQSKWVEQTVVAVSVFIMAAILAIFGGHLVDMGYGQAGKIAFGVVSALVILGGAAMIGPEDALETLAEATRQGHTRKKRGRA